MAILSPAPFLQFFDPSSRLPLTGGRIFTYDSGTTTPATTYQDAAQTTPHPNPIVLDAAGTATIYLASGQAYRFVIQKANGATVATVDDIVAYDTASLSALVAAEIASGIIAVANGGTGADNAADALDNLGVIYPYDFVIACSDETTTIAAGSNVARFIAPRAFELTEVIGSLNTASSSGLVQVNLTRNGVSVFTTQLTIDQGETTSLTAATPAVLTSPAISVAKGDLFGVSIVDDGTNAAGLKLYLVGWVFP